jgi:hypothetical protein
MLVMLTVIFIQVVLGFASDTKSGAMLGGVLVIVTSFLVNGRVPKLWLACGVVLVIVAFPIFQAHRAITVNQQGMSNAQTARHIGSALQTALQNEKLVSSDFGGAQAYHSQSFFERMSVKSSVDMIVKRTGNDVAYQHGYTLIPLLTSFIPRFFWPDKLDVQTGELLNEKFHVTDDSVTYISPSYLGELYWNFGWAGTILSMVLFGAMLGWINRLCDLSSRTSLTRLLIMAITIYQLCVRFEGSIAVQFAVWLRSVMAILLMHWAFARHTDVSTGLKRAKKPMLGLQPQAELKFPNLMS